MLDSALDSYENQNRVRIESIDVVRGAVMVLMALDHVRDFFHIPGVNPTDLAQTTIPYFFMQWITHFCAPVFFLLTGTGAYLSLRKKSKRELSRFPLTRGLWLIFLELVVVRCFGWAFNFNYHFTMVQVLWTLGWAMIVPSALVYLPASVVMTFGGVGQQRQCSNDAQETNAVSGGPQKDRSSAEGMMGQAEGC